MPIELKMPALSPTMEEGTLARWLVKEGDSVAAGDVMAEIETDKATMEFEAVDEGVIAKILVEEGTDEVKVGTVIAILAEEGEDAKSVAASGASAKAPPADKPKETKKVEGEGGETGAGQPAKETKAAEPAPPAPSPAPAPPRDGERIKASPLARRLAQARGIDLSTLKGSGPGGRIVKADIEGAAAPEKAAAAQPAAAAAPSPAPAEPATVETDIPHEAAKLSNMRKIIARRLTEAKQQIPHIYLTVDTRIDALLELRSRLNKELEPRGIKISVNDMLIKALAISLMEVPECNVALSGDQLLTYKRADISVAVSIPGGLITPIIRSADSRSLSSISAEMTELAARARDGKLMPHEYQGGTASISNMGMFGIKHFDAVINPPQAMIMAIGAGEKRPYVIDDSLQVATIMSVTGSYDHRAIDGADGARHMQAFKRLVENPLAMLA